MAKDPKSTDTKTDTRTDTKTNTDVNKGKIVSEGSKTKNLDNASEGNAQ